MTAASTDNLLAYKQTHFLSAKALASVTDCLCHLNSKAFVQALLE